MKTAIIGMLLSPFLLVAQQNSGAWTNIGPTPAAVAAIAVDSAHSSSGTIFMGLGGGGVRSFQRNGNGDFIARAAENAQWELLDSLIKEKKNHVA